MVQTMALRWPPPFSPCHLAAAFCSGIARKTVPWSANRGAPFPDKFELVGFFGDPFYYAWATRPGDTELRDAINAGLIEGPHMQVSGPILGITGGHCDENLLPFEYHYSADGVADGIPAVQHKVREY